MLIENTVGKMSDNLTSVVLAVSVITLTLGYISKLVLKQSQSSSEEHKVCTWRINQLSYSIYYIIIRSATVNVTVSRRIHSLLHIVQNHKIIWLVYFIFVTKLMFFFSQKYPPYIPSSIPFLGHAIAFGKSPIEFLENAYEKVRIQYCCKVYLIYFSAQSATYFCLQNVQ